MIKYIQILPAGLTKKTKMTKHFPKLTILSSLKLLLLLITLAFNLPIASAQPQLKFAEAFNILAVNGTQYNGGLVSQKRNLSLNAGINYIAIEYEEVFESEDDDNFDVIKSNAYLVKIYLKRNGKYQQRFIKPHNADAARKYRLNPLFNIIELNQIDNKQQSVNFEIHPLASNDIAYVVANTRVRQNTNTINLTNSGLTKSKPSGTHNPTVKGQSMASKMLNYWWHQATPEERKAFLHSIKATQK